MRKCLLTAAVASLFAPGVTAQTASFAYIDQKAPYRYSCSPPCFMLWGPPKIGSVFTVQSRNSVSYPTSSWQYFLAVGTRNPDIDVRPLRGWLYTSAEVVILAPRSNSIVWVLHTRIPNSNQLLGVRFYQQVLVVVRAQGHTIPWLTRGAACVIGR